MTTIISCDAVLWNTRYKHTTKPLLMLDRFWPLSLPPRCPEWWLAGAEIASEGLKGRVFEFSLGDLNNDEDLVRDAETLFKSSTTVTVVFVVSS